MRSILRKCAVGAVAVGGVLFVQPGNFALGAQEPATPRAAARKCVREGQQARVAATNQFRKDIKAARELGAGEQQAAVKAAQDKYQKAAETARAAFSSCIGAIDPG